jgi:hypothetical protein
MLNLMKVGQGQKLHIQWMEGVGATRCGIGMTLNVKQPRSISNMPSFTDAAQATQYLQTHSTQGCKSCMSYADHKDGE